MTDWKETLKDNKEMASIMLFIGVALGQGYIPPGYRETALIVSFAPVLVMAGIMGLVAKYEAGIKNIIVADVNHSKYEYPGGNSHVQFVLGPHRRVIRLGPNRWYVIWGLLHPYIVHPEDPGIYPSGSEIRTLRFFIDHHPNFMFTGKKRSFISSMGEIVRSEKTDTAVLDEIGTYTDPKTHRTEPRYECIMGTESYAFRHTDIRHDKAVEAEDLLEKALQSS